MTDTPLTTTTTTTTVPTVPTAGVPFGPGDPRPGFARAVALGGDVIGAVRADQLTLPTPCDRYDVRDLCGHLVAVLQRIAAVARGESPFSVPQEARGVADDGWRAAWDAAAHEVQAAWTDDDVLSRPLTLPFATLPGAAALAIYTSEVMTHTWDLATATGQRPDWDTELAERALATMRTALPAEHRGGEVPFAAPVPVADDAPAIDRLVAWVGRRP